MKTILSGPISGCIEAPIFTPAPAFGDDPFNPGPVEGEEPVDFSGLETGEFPEPEVKTEQAKVEPEVKKEEGEEFPEIPESKPEGEKKTTEEETPDPETEIAEAATKAAEEAAKAVADKTVEKKVEEKLKDTKLPTDAEIEAMKPRDNAPHYVVKSFNDMKAIIKAAVPEVKRLTAEVERLSKGGALTPEIQARLAQADEDRKIAATFQLENDPIIRKDFEEKVGKAEGDLFALLRSNPDLRLPEKGLDGVDDKGNPVQVFSIEKFKAIGLDTPAGRAELNRMIAQVRKHTGDELLVDEIKSRIRDRAVVVDAHNKTIEELRGGSGKIIEQRQEQQRLEHEAWGAKARDHVKKVYDEKPDIYQDIATKAIPEGATKEQIKEIEEHNKAVNEVNIPLFTQRIQAFTAKDPEKGMEIVMASMRVPRLEKELETERENSKKLSDRIAELEGDIGRVRRVSTVDKESSTPAKGARASTGGAHEVPADEAFAEFEREQGLK